MKTISFSTLMAAPAAAPTAQSAKIQTIQDIYACFGQGDIPGILSRLSDNIVFEHNGNFPWSGSFEGMTGAGEFFQTLGANVQVTGFQPSNFRIEGGKVVNDCRFDGVALPTGKSFGYDLLMTWTFGSDGKPVRYHGLADENQLPQAEAAFKK